MVLPGPALRLGRWVEREEGLQRRLEVSRLERALGLLRHDGGMPPRPCGSDAHGAGDDADQLA